MLLAEAANAVDLRLPGIRDIVSCLLFDPVELLEEPECLFRKRCFPRTLTKRIGLFRRLLF